MIERYSIGEINHLWSDKAKFELWLRLEARHCAVLRPELAASIEQRLAEILASNELNIDTISAYERETKHDVVAFLKHAHDLFADDEIKRWLHFGLTSSDIIDTSFILHLRESTKLLLSEIKEKLVPALARKSEEVGALKAIGRTHGVHAEPIDFRAKFDLFASELERVANRLNGQLDANLKYGKLRGPVGSSAGLTAAQEAEILGAFELEPLAVVTQIIPRDIIAPLFFDLALLGTVLERFATEVRLLSRTECAEVSEKFYKKQYGSSAMPHKKNPVASENICGMGRLLRSHVTTALENIVLWHERDISHSSVERVIAPDAFHLALYATRRMCDVVENLQIYPENIQRNLELVDTSSQGRMNKDIQDGRTRFEAYEQARSS